MSFQKTHASKTGLRDYHKLITIFFKTDFSRLRPKVVSNRNYKIFGAFKFLHSLNKTIITFDNENHNQNYVLSEIFRGRQCSRSAKKIARGNDTPFVDKQLRKAIYT